MPYQTSTNNHYPLTALMTQARQEAPKGQTFAVKRVIMPPKLVPDIDVDMIRLRVLRTRPERYMSGVDQLTGGLAVANFAVIVEELQPTRITRGALGERGRPVTAVQFQGRLLLPHVRSVEASGAYVPGEDSTSFVHIHDREKLPAMEDVFENGLLQDYAGLDQLAARPD